MPPPPPPKTRRRSKVIDNIQYAYTIHDSTQKPFTMQLPLSTHDFNVDAITKTTIVSFKEESNALKMAKLLEMHKAINKDWPATVFDDNFSLHLYARENQQLQIGEELSVMQWRFNDLREYCVDNIIDLMYIKVVVEKTTGLSFKSDLIRLEMDHDFYVNRFAVMFSRV